MLKVGNVIAKILKMEGIEFVACFPKTPLIDACAQEGIEAEPISAGMPAKKIYKFIENNAIVLIVNTDGRSGLCRWASEGLTERYVQFLCEHIFGPMQPTRQEQS